MVDRRGERGRFQQSKDTLITRAADYDNNLEARSADGIDRQVRRAPFQAARRRQGNPTRRQWDVGRAASLKIRRLLWDCMLSLHQERKGVGKATERISGGAKSTE